MRLLFLTTMLPAGMRNGGELWSQTIVNALAGAGAGAQVTVLGYGDCRAPGEISAGHHQVETRGAPLFAALAAIRAVGRTAFTVQKWKSAAYRRALEGLLGERWDAAVIDHAQMGWVQPLLEARSIPFFYLAHHAEHQLYATLAAAARLPMRAVYRREARCLAAVERRLLHGAVESWCISERDVALLRTCADGPVRSLPALGAAALADPEASSSGPDLALLGNWRWTPNRHALDWFLREVGPKLPAAWVVHVGGAADADLVGRYPGAVFLGPVPDAGAFLRAARRIAVPSFAAQGLNLKLIDAIASGRPVVASAAALALAGEVPPDIAGAESAEAFAAALINVERVDREARRRWLEARQAELGAAVADALARLGGPRKRTGDGAGAP